MNKYEFTNKRVGINVSVGAGGNAYISLQQIRALIDIPKHGVKKGDIGGWIESVKNLSQTGDCWIDENVKVYSQAKVTENALLKGDITVKEFSQIGKNVKLTGDCLIIHSYISDDVTIHSSRLEKSEVTSNVRIDTSSLKNVLVKGEPGLNFCGVTINHSTLMGERQKIAIENRNQRCISIEACDLRFEDEPQHSEIHGWGKLKGVVGKSIKTLWLHEEIELSFVELKGRVSLISLEGAKGWHLFGSLMDGNIVFEDGVFSMLNPKIEGRVHLKGNLLAENVAVSGFSRILNKTDDLLCLSNVTIQDMVQIIKSNNPMQPVVSVSNRSLSGDALVYVN